MNEQKLDVYELIKDKLQIKAPHVPDLIIPGATQPDASDVLNHDHYKDYVNSIVNYIENASVPMVKNESLPDSVGYTYNQIFGYVITTECSFGLVVRNAYNLRQIIIIFPTHLNYEIQNHKSILAMPSYSFTWGYEPINTSLELKVASINKLPGMQSIIYYKALNPVANNTQNILINTYDIGSIQSEIFTNTLMLELLYSGIFTDWFRVDDDKIMMSLFQLDDKYDCLEQYSYNDSFDRLKTFIKQYYKVKYPENHKDKSKELIEYLKGIIENIVPLKQSIPSFKCSIDISNINKRDIRTRIMASINK